MDSRFSDLRTTLAYEGLSEEERRRGYDLLESSAPLCDAYATLLRGALAERGNWLASPLATKQRGLVAGAKLITGLLTEHRGRALTNEDVTRGLLAISKAGNTSVDLLAMYLKTHRYCFKQQAA